MSHVPRRRVHWCSHFGRLRNPKGAAPSGGDTVRQSKGSSHGKRHVKTRNDWGKPYIRRANGHETSDSFRMLWTIAGMIDQYGRRGYYVLVQRGVPNSVMAVGESRAQIIRCLVGCFYQRFSSWSNNTKRLAQADSSVGFVSFNKAARKKEIPNRYRKRSLAKRLLAKVEKPF